MYKTFNQINKEIREILLYFLNDFKITDFKVLQLNQPTKTTDKDNCLFFQILNTNNYGWQSVKYKQEEERYIKQNEFVEKIQVKISCLKTRKATDTVEEKESKDIITLLKSWLLSDDGLKYLNSKEISILIPMQIDLSDFVNENDNFEFLPSLTLTVFIKQKWIKEVEVIEEINNKTLENV